MRRSNIVGTKGRPAAKSCGCIGRWGARTPKQARNRQQEMARQATITPRPVSTYLDGKSSLDGAENAAIEAWLSSGNSIKRIEQGEWPDTMRPSMSEWAKKRERLAAAKADPASSGPR